MDRTYQKQFIRKYMTKIVRRKSMVTLYDWAIKNEPGLLEEWDYDMNADINIKKVAAHSSKKVFWRCPQHKHIYSARIQKRVQGHRCIYCTNHAVLVGFNDLQSQYPDIALDLDEEKNAFCAKDITYGNTKKINWKCHVCKFEWTTSAARRTRYNTGCPACSKRRSIEKRKLLQIEKTGGLQKYQNLLAQWDYERNGNVDPLKVNIHDKRSFYWKCQYGQHSFPAKISYRVSNSNCPYCTGKKVLKGFNDIESQCKNVMIEWDYDNNDILPSEVVYTATTPKIHWKCSFCGKTFSTEPCKHRECGCKICKQKMRHKNIRIEKTSSGGGIDKEKYYDIYLDWDCERNKTLDYYWEEMTPSFTKKVYWKCHTCGYSWMTSVYRRIQQGTGCPACSHRILVPGINDLETECPDLATEWSNKNVKKANEIIAGSDKPYIWQCRFCNYEWTASIHNRRTEGSNCPKCSGANTSFAEQAIFYYIKKFYPDAINRYIDITTNKEIDIYIPMLNLGIEYDGYVFHKDKKEFDDKKTQLLQDNGIKLVRVREYKNVKLPTLDVKPYLCLDYLYSSRYNGLDKIIADILTNTGKIKTKIDTYSDRFKILHLYHQKILENSFATTKSPCLQLWDYEKNYPLSPSEITKGSGIEVYWKCNICGFEWVNSVNAEQKCKGCRRCNKRVAHKHYNILSKYPHIVDDWITEMNNNKNPVNILPDTHKKFWWKCSVCGKPHLDTPTRWSQKRRCSDCGQELGRKKRCKPVAQYNENNELIKVYESARAASEETGISYKAISSVCNNKRKTANGYIWKFVNVD